MAQLVRMIADFPNVTYLLAYDREQVIRALGEFSGSKSTADEASLYGEGYLQKIVHSAYKLPLPPESAITETIFNRFYERTQPIYGSAPFQRNYWLQIKNIMSDFWPTLRHGERVINRATQVATMLKDKSNPADVLVAAYLMEYQPRLWDWLWLYRQEILSSTAYNFKQPSESFSFFPGRIHQPNGIGAIVNSSITSIESLDTLLSEVFHNSHSRPIGDYHLGSESSMEHYYRYEESPSTEAIELARKIAAARPKDFKQLLKKVKRTDGYAYSFFKALSSQLPQGIDWNGFSLPLLKELGAVFENVPRHGYTLPAEHVFRLAEKIINRLPEERRSQAVLELQRQWVDSGLPFLATRLVGSIAAAKGWIPSNADNPSKIDFSAPDNVKMGLIKNLQNQFKSLSSDRESGKKLLAHHMAPYILYKWKIFSPEDASAYIASCLNNEYLIFALINSFVGTGYSADAPDTEKRISPTALYDITDKQPNEVLAILEAATQKNSHAAANYPELLSIVRESTVENQSD